jgi:hypothetical protein
MDEEVYRITKDKDRARDLLGMSNDRLRLMKSIPKEMTFKAVEEYYEIIKELLTAVMYIDGYKTLSHVKLIEYFSSNYKVLDEKQIRMIDTLRKYRIGIVYYGRRVGEEFLANNQDEINDIIKVLLALVESKLKK